MAKLTALPHQDIIDGFKGKLDFYVNYQTRDPKLRGKGVPCARRWPRSPGHRRAAAVEAQWLAFTFATQSWDFLSPEIQQAYRDTAEDTHMSGRDLYVKSFLTSYFRKGQWEYEEEPPPPPPYFSMGSDPIDRASTLVYNYTAICKENPANEDGTLALVKLHLAAAATNIKIAIFELVGPNTFTTRSYQNIGNAPIGYSEHEVTLEVKAGDYIGWKPASGSIERDNLGEGYWAEVGDFIPCTNKLFTFYTPRTMSLFGESL